MLSRSLARHPKLHSPSYLVRQIATKDGTHRKWLRSILAEAEQKQESASETDDSASETAEDSDSSDATLTEAPARTSRKTSLRPGGSPTPKKMPVQYESIDFEFSDPHQLLQDTKLEPNTSTTPPSDYHKHCQFENATKMKKDAVDILNSNPSFRIPEKNAFAQIVDKIINK